ncbi:MAG: ribulose-phosphate 3-epimerase [Alphaproteobacteria bacterium]|nr:ribulose-phosphate 3-epimerase [Alphaproteobacteria bacterium]NDC56093.1 ribulose-phosphate 3-epimerase [Alphaproteobacteria bacterium]NDG04068.1 ribulose-phosphate 3-epimerase [Alphaproteobacteria bacterium]
MPVKIAPSLLAADFAAMGQAVRDMTAAGADWLHFDVMDGHFVPNITFGPAMVKALRPHSSLPFDVHLMIAPVDPYVAAFAEAGADIITVHPESGPHLHRTLQLIKSFGKKCGVVLNPATPLSVLDHVLPDIDVVLVMSVNPGFGGQSFIRDALGKIRLLRQAVQALGRPMEIEVDGGMNAETACACAVAGASVLVAGTATFAGGPEKYAQNLKDLRG